jgi:hypothetical protein
MPKKLDRVNFTTVGNSEQAITGKIIRGSGCNYYVGYNDAEQPSIAINVDSYDRFSQISFDYDQASLKAAQRLVKEIKRGIKERDDA